MGSNSFFASELRRLRKARGWTREELARRMNFSESAVQKVELGQRAASPDIAEAADRAFGLSAEFADHFKRMRQKELEPPAVPDWFQPYSEKEHEATRIWCFGLSVIPGLLQVEDYARALLADEARVAARMERQDILARDSPPEFVAVIDERALRYLVGSSKVMYAQLEHLAAVGGRLVIQVLPADCGTYRHLDGPFTIVTSGDRDFAYAETPLEGFLRAEPEILSSARARWDLIRAEALPRRQSIDLIREVAEQWT